MKDNDEVISLGNLSTRRINFGAPTAHRAALAQKMKVPLYLAHGIEMIAYVLGWLLCMTVFTSICFIAARQGKKTVAIVCGTIGLTLAFLALSGGGFRVSLQIDSVVPWLAALFSFVGIAIALWKMEKPIKSSKTNPTTRSSGSENKDSGEN